VVDPALGILTGSERRSIVEVRAAVPLTVPGLVERLGQLVGMRAIPAGAIGFAPGIRDVRETPDQAAREPAEPDALAASPGADQVHAVVPVADPHQRQAM